MVAERAGAGIWSMTSEKEKCKDCGDGESKIEVNRPSEQEGIMKWMWNSVPCDNLIAGAALCSVWAALFRASHRGPVFCFIASCCTGVNMG